MWHSRNTRTLIVFDICFPEQVKWQYMTVSWETFETRYSVH